MDSMKIQFMSKNALYEKYYVGETIEQTQILSENSCSKSSYLSNLFNSRIYKILLKLFKIGAGSTIQIDAVF